MWVEKIGWIRRKLQTESWSESYNNSMLETSDSLVDQRKPRNIGAVSGDCGLPPECQHGVRRGRYQRDRASEGTHQQSLERCGPRRKVSRHVPRIRQRESVQRCAASAGQHEHPKPNNVTTACVHTPTCTHIHTHSSSCTDLLAYRWDPWARAVCFEYRPQMLCRRPVCLPRRHPHPQAANRLKTTSSRACAWRRGGGTEECTGTKRVAPFA